MKQLPLILASSSPWRRELLDRMHLTYRAIAPAVDESPRDNESPADLVQRLARTKAETVAAQHPDSVVIGSDQVADLAGRVLGKPGTRKRAVVQLKQLSGQQVVFRTGLCVRAPGGASEIALVNVDTVFRTLSDAEIERYVDAEDVTATAGSLKSEGLGITLVESIRSDDPTALIGLPLIALRRLLAENGIELP